MTDTQLLRQLLAILREIRKDIHTIREKQQSYNKGCDDQIIQPLQVEVALTPKLDPARQEYYESENRARDSFWEKIKPWLEGIGVGVAITLAAFTFITLRQITRQADSAQTQAGIMQKQLEATDRPWVKLVEIKTAAILFAGPSFPGKFGYRDEATLNVVPAISDIGRSPAVNVRVFVLFIVQPWANGWGDFEKQRNLACMGAEKIQHTNTVLFPGDPPFDSIGFGGNQPITDATISRLGDGTKYIAPAFAGCIDYQFEPHSAHHQTGFVFEVARTDNRSRIFLLGEDMIGLNKITVIRDSQYDTAN